MAELIPVLRHKDTETVQAGLRVVRDRKEDAGEVAAEVAALLEHDEEGGRTAALATLEVLGPAARKGLPRLFEVLGKMPKYEGTSLALTASRIVDYKDAESVRRLVPFLVAGLHPVALQSQGEKAEAVLNGLLRKIGQPAVEGIFAVLDPKTRGRGEFQYRVTLYDALAGLGPRCKSDDNYETLRELRNRELKKLIDPDSGVGCEVGALATRRTQVARSRPVAGKGLGQRHGHTPRCAGTGLSALPGTAGQPNSCWHLCLRPGQSTPPQNPRRSEVRGHYQRRRLIGFRDLDEGEFGWPFVMTVRESAFTRDFQAFREEVGKLQAANSGRNLDEPESCLQGLALAVSPGRPEGGTALKMTPTRQGTVRG